MTPTKHYTQLDGIRFIAVFLVLIDHWLAEKNNLPLGPLGVTIFFVLSGFLITGILLKSKIKDEALNRNHLFSFRQFYIRRSIRIFPIYYLSVFVLFVFNSPSVVGKVWWHLFYATNFFIAIKGTWLGITDHFWSLAVEEQFYLFFPLLVFAIPQKHLSKLFWGMIVVAITSRLILFLNHADWTIQYVSTITSLDAFGMGALLALSLSLPSPEDRVQSLSLPSPEDRVQNLSLPSPKERVLLGLVLLIGIVVLEKILPEKRNFATEVLERTCFSIFSLILINQAIHGFNGLMKHILENKIIVFLGKISYEIGRAHV